ncbi:DUF1129 family protein [Ligilactobacillus murinus]|jgi:uncharacterized membrane-anchored protein|uniref:DUF1129 domain-containing protein n=1 Tax=Ligilactobacillus murinus TaxID=1622 RepID=A0A4Q2AZY4_9LACO|nr:DUF1129 family protein [Ligilactobacillus murinus]NBH84390.1 DUF1129 domain-containing protein [Lachnospiraceae bacterium]MBF0702150.1 DUF1129 domain-containing protein [Ligilactobacillus murinus]MCR1880191.1 DUF1129 domain-containing protein [Ligilactobacillus murinus]MCZ0673454.1 DUF1129 family protein [Ligilactobacillus murinus]MCZ0694135.1 DUF1129 family protein [Ligilactobacillus murinus]
MAESKRNEKAAQQQQARAKAVEVTMRDGKFSGLTKRNEDYLFHLDKALTEKNYDPEQKEQVLTEMYQELKEKQKQGVVATKLYGTVTEKAELIVNGPKKSEAPTELPKFWILALDNGLIMFIMFCIMYTLLGVFSPKQADVSGGWITLLATSTIAGVGLAFFYRSMLSARKEKGKKRWIKTILITLELILIWIVAFGVIAFIPVSINRTMEPIVYAILAGLGYLVRRYLKKKYNFRSVMF